MMKKKFHSIDVGGNVPDTFRAVIEIPQENRNKYEIHDGLLMLDRVLHAPLSYPMNYGFIPNTKAKDGDPLDVLVWSRYPFTPLCVVPSRALGMLKMRDEEGEDNKILAVTLNDAFFDGFQDVDNVQENLLKEVSHFFKRYKELEENKTTKVKGWYNKKTAKEYIIEAVKRYKNRH